MRHPLRHLITRAPPTARLLAAVAVALVVHPTVAPAQAPAVASPATLAPVDDLRVATVEVTGIEEVTPPVRLPRRLPLRRGQPYSTERVDATELVLRSALAESGRPYASIEVSATVDHAAGVAHILFEIDPGPEVVFGEVEVQAAPPFRERDIRPRVAYEPGDLISISAVEATRHAILALPGVDEVVVELPGLERGELVVPSIIRVARPDRLADVGLRATLSSLECVEVGGRWRHQFFLGEPRLFSISGGFTNLFAALLDGDFPCASAGEDVYAQPNYYLSTDLYQPLRVHPTTAVQARAFFRRRTSPQSYLLHGFGLHLSALRDIRPETRVRLSYYPERNELRAAGHYFCVNFGACDDAAIARLSGWQWLAPVEAALQWVPAIALEPFGPAWAREAGLWPGAIGPVWRPMARLTVSSGAGLTGSDFTYLRGEAEAAVARVLTPRTEAAVRLRAGGLLAGDDVLPPQVRFYSGGPVTVRGVRQNLLGPLVLVADPEAALEAGCAPEPGGCPAGAMPPPHRVSVRPRGGVAVVEGNVEGRLWLTTWLQLAAFADAGVVVGDTPIGDVGGRDWDGMVAPGLGLRWLSPMGPIRVDVGYDPRPSRMVPMLLQEPGTEGLVVLGDVVWAPHTHDSPGGWREFRRRLQFHLAVGQPF